MLKLVKIMAVSITAIILIKYKPVYGVSISGKEIGNIQDKAEFEKTIIEKIEKENDENIAYITFEEEPQYELKWLARKEQTNEENVLLALKDASIPTYEMYAVKFEGENKAYVKSMEEAEEMIEEIKNEYQKDLELDLQIEPIYTASLEEVEPIEVAKTNLDQEVKSSDMVRETLKLASVNGVSIFEKPVSGTITSRFASVSSIRSGSHTGLDIATKSGTPVKVCSEGTVKFAGTKGSYGKLVIISHANGVETWYGHNSKLYVTKGQSVKAGDTIAAVGSTGNSTGPHLHFEIRINGTPVNPQKYLYK